MIGFGMTVHLFRRIGVWANWVARFGLFLLAFLTVGTEGHGTKQKLHRLSESKAAECGDLYGFDYRTLRLGEDDYCVHEFVEIESNSLAAIWMCEVLEPEQASKPVFACLRKWWIIDMQTGDLSLFNPPLFHQTQSCPSFRGRYCAYYGIDGKPEAGYTLFAMVVDVTSGQLVKKERILRYDFETDNPCHLGPPQWATGNKAYQVTFGAGRIKLRRTVIVELMNESF